MRQIRKPVDAGENPTEPKIRKERPSPSQAKVLPRGELGSGIPAVTPKDKKRGKGVSEVEEGFLEVL